MPDPTRDPAPVTPVEISVFIEAGRYVFRTDDSLPIYSFDEDGRHESRCYATCAITWRPVLAPSTANTVGDWTVIERTDHSRQWSYKGKPVYTYARDRPGELTGDGVDGLWHVVTP